MDFLPGRREQRECFTPGAEADSGPGKDRKKKSLPGRESFNSSLKREAGAAKAQNESSVIGVSPPRAPQPGAQPRSSSSPGSLPSLAPAGRTGIFGLLQAAGGRASGWLERGALGALLCHPPGLGTWGFRPPVSPPSSLTSAYPDL